MEDNEKSVLFKRACTEWVMTRMCISQDLREHYSHLYYHTTYIISDLNLTDEYLNYAEEVTAFIFKLLTKYYFQRERHENTNEVRSVLEQYFTDNQLDKLRI